MSQPAQTQKILSEQERTDLLSRETMFRFYAKDTDKLKRLKTPGYVGLDPIFSYYQKYKNLEREQEFGKEGYSASTAYLNQIHSLKTLPSPMMGLIQHRGKEGQIKARNLKMGKQYAIALSSSMKFLSNTETIDLPGNRLGKQGGTAILTSLVDKVKCINLDNNNIGSEALQNLVNWIDTISTRCQLEELSLSNNNFGDQLTIDLVDALIKANAPLVSIDLSHNQIGDRGAIALGDILATHYHLKIVKIGWNKIQTRGGIAIAEALKDNQRIQVFDGSFNQFGMKRNGIFGLKMGEACNNGILRHIDISYNSMDENECEKFGEVIKENHTLWGLHIMGNSCILDSMGYVRTKIKSKNQTRDILHKRMNDGIHFLATIRNQKDAKIRSYQCCWVCEGWREVKFEWNVGRSGKNFKEPVYIHFDFDEYRPWLLEKDEEDGGFYIWKMIPPGKSHYFYSYGGENGESEIAIDQPHLKLLKTKIIKDIKFQEREGEKQTLVEFSCNFQLHKLNYTLGNQQRVLDENYEPVKYQQIVPRLSDKIYIRPFSERPRTPWSFPISIFKDYQIDNDAKMMECFEFDWSNMKFPKMSDDEMSAVKEELRKAYKTIRESFKYLSAVGFGGNVWSIPLNCYTDFVKQINLVDGNIIRFAQSDTEFITMNKRSKVSNLNPGVALVRFQFLEILMRLAFKRYEETKEAKSKSEAVRMMFEKNIFPFYGELNAQKFRDDKYWNEEVDNLYKSHFPIFNYLYKTFGCHYLKPGDKPFMMVDEFENIFQTAGLISDNFASRDVAVCFNSAMMTQVNELDRDRHLKAVFIEFLEAYGRSCDKISLAPMNVLQNDDDDEEETKQMTDQERASQPLYKKIENSLPVVYQNCMSNAFKEKWKWPKIDPKTGLYVDKYFKKKKKGGNDLSALKGEGDLIEVEEGSPEVIKSIFE